jgi:hypothetical protein
MISERFEESRSQKEGLKISTKLQVPAFVPQGGTSRRQAKYQISSNHLNSRFPSPFPSPLRGEGGVRGVSVIVNLEFGNYLEFEI